MMIQHLLAHPDITFSPTHDEQMLSQSVQSLVNDTRKIVQGSVFLAAKGISSHALEHLSTEQYALATAIIYEPPFDISKFSHNSHKFIAVDNLHKHVGTIANIFFSPTFNSPLIGVTGTNGKTSVSQFISQLADYAFIGTMGYGRGKSASELSNTTPDPLLCQKILSHLAETYSGVAMEVSSHAMSLHRVDSVNFSVATFTNLSQDHLDFHDDMEDYFNAKAQLFNMPCVKTAVINTDDAYGYRLAISLKDSKKVIAFGAHLRAQEFDEHVIINDINLSQQGISTTLKLHLESNSETVQLASPVWGAFNVYNIIAALLSLYACDKNVLSLIDKTKNLHGITGRIESINCGNKRTAIIDYAHTPDALKNTLLSLREHMVSHAHTNNTDIGTLYTVFGCGGDRDSSKRPLMAEEVNNHSDYGIITDDNPRTEDRQTIFDDILSGNIDTEKFTVIPSRKDAIIKGLESLSANDVLLIAGKGHEDYQIIGTEKIHFSDHEVVRQWSA